MVKKFDGDYFVGLDVGTSSVGWAITNDSYDVLHHNKKAMLGARLFDEAQTAAARRINRSARRRLSRRKVRIQLLQMLFNEEIAKVDFPFFMRLKASGFFAEDKGVDGKFSYFNDEDYTDVEFYKDYPTIYHLRYDLMTSNEPKDIRLVYLALHHLIKHRGHHLYEGDFTSVASLPVESYFEDLKDLVLKHTGEDIQIPDVSACKEILTAKENSSTKNNALKGLIISESGQKKLTEAISKILCGMKGNLYELFLDETLKETTVKSLAIPDIDDQKEGELVDILGERYEVIEALKQIHDWAILDGFLSGHKTLSEAKIALYEEHRKDLAMLKKATKELCPKRYDDIFGDSEIGNNYSKYIGQFSRNGKNEKGAKTRKQCSAEELYKYLVDIWKKENITEALAKKYPLLQEKIDNATLLPKQKVSANGVIPYQLQFVELKAILDKAEQYLPFLSEKDEKGLSVRDKIESIFLFRIPYYVGPLNRHGKNAWLVKNEDFVGKIYPWNFEEAIDIEASAEAFIKRMTNKCSYFPMEDVLPNQSILYSKFKVLNELNNLRLNNEKLDVDTKQLIFEKVFLKNKTVGIKKVESFLISEGIIAKPAKGEAKHSFTGIDKNFANSMSSYKDFADILGVDHLSAEQEQIAETIIADITLFGGDKKLLRKRLKTSLKDVFTPEQIDKISKLKYSGWGRLSKKFLAGFKGSLKKSAEPAQTIIDALYECDGNPNLMELLSNDYTYMEYIEQKQAESLKGQSLEAMLEEAYVSPAVKRAIYQTMGIMGELRKVMKKDPKRIFLEMARGADGSSRTKSRQEQLIELYKNCLKDVKSLDATEKKEIKSLQERVNAEEKNRLQGKRLFLYYLQMGRCMYSGEPIRLEDLHTHYDIDHIYPQSYVKDDSMNNIVLVKREYNAKKSDIFPLSEEIRSKQKGFWSYLLKLNFISKEKYNRLTRNTEFSDGELAGFINRQLVETRQSTKVLGQVLQSFYPETEIVYVKAGNISAFRQGINDIKNMPKLRDEKEELKLVREHQNKFLKSRAINNHHHAKDAYLAIVVGNVYHTQFTASPYIFIDECKKKKRPLNILSSLYRREIERAGKVAWVPSTFDAETGEIQEGTMATVHKYMRRQNVLVTYATSEVTGALYDVTPMSKGLGQIPKKANGPLSNIDRYGGYNKAAGAYFFAVEHGVEGKRELTLEPLFIKDAMTIKNKEDLLAYCEKSGEFINPRIVVAKIKMGTTFEKGNSRIRLYGRTGNQLVFRNSTELNLPQAVYDYLRHIESGVRKLKEKKKETIDETIISKEMNIEVYDLLVNKCNAKGYADLHGDKIDKLLSYKEKFETIDEEGQCKILLELLHLFDTTAVVANLTAIGGVATYGRLYNNKKITKDNFSIVYISKTGLFENKVDLKIE